MNLQRELDRLLQLPAYGLSNREKSAEYAKILSAVTEHHFRKCPGYRKFINALESQSDSFSDMKKTRGEESDSRETRLFAARSFAMSEENIPFLPVSIFKEIELRSIPEEEIYKEITSSGTSGQRLSHIYLDRWTSSTQQQVLARIVAEELGGRRLPCLMLDTRSVLRDRRIFSARGAGILGFSMFASRICYALDENMQLNLEEIQTFIEDHRRKAVERGEKPKFMLYGFTYMVWQHFVRALEEAGVTLDLAGSVLIHGGGWKKLQDQVVSPEEFAVRIRAATGIEIVRSYYGMAEQTGSICMECPCGNLHTSTWSDILVRRERDYSVCDLGEPGILQVLTPIALSYPGHSLLTEDRGVLLGEDDCPCGRKGKYFKVLGRLPKAEIRGCSDTFETEFHKPESPGEK